MKVGCGFVEKEIRGNRYLYFWSFQGHGARVKKVEWYMGPASDPDARRWTLVEIEEYAGRANAELAERVAAWRRELGRPGAASASGEIKAVLRYLRSSNRFGSCQG